jgi:hypothetical protein
MPQFDEELIMKRGMFLLLTILVGCGGTRAALRVKAASDFKCDQSAIKTESAGALIYYEHASGCSKENWYIYDGKIWVSPLDRASFEISCPLDQLSAQQLDRMTIGVTGCAKKVVYVLVVGVGGGKWVLNSSSEPTANVQPH